MLVLASSSPYRRALLERLGLPFRTLSPEIDESPRAGEAPARLALRLAREKAERGMTLLEGTPAVVIASDQVAELDGEPLGKPGTPERCVAQLLRCSGRTVTFHTGLAVVATPDGTSRSLCEPFTVQFRTLDEARVRRYVALESPLDAAGGFYCEGLGITLFERFEGRDPNALVGLPLMALVDLLRDVGVDPLAVGEDEG